MFAVLHIPHFPLQAALRHEPEQWTAPTALVDPARNPPVVCDATEPARAAGVTDGLTSPQAMARCRAVAIRRRAPAQEEAAMDALLQAAYAFSPRIEATAPGVCTLDLRALARLAGADAAAIAVWAGTIRQALAAQNLRARVGVGPTPNVARQAARWTEGIEIVGDPGSFLASLPVAALEPSSDVSGILQKWGIRTVGELLALGQAELVDRLGLEALALFAAASATASRPLRHAQPPERFEEAFEFEHEIETMEPLLFIVRRFVDQLSLRLELSGFVAESLTLRLRLEAGAPLERRLRVPQPTRRADVLFRMLHTYLETLRTDSPIKALTLTASPGQPEQKQFGLFEAALRDPHQFQETLARLAGLVGADRVGTPVLEDSHRSDAFRLIPPDFENAPPVSPRPSAAALQPVPVRRLRPAPAATVETAPNEARADAPPVSVHCAVANGKLSVVVGPWRASGNWWEPGAWQREEWDAVTKDGKVIRLAKRPEGWFVEGVLD